MIYEDQKNRLFRLEKHLNDKGCPVFFVPKKFVWPLPKSKEGWNFANISPEKNWDFSSFLLLTCSARSVFLLWLPGKYICTLRFWAVTGRSISRNWLKRHISWTNYKSVIWMLTHNNGFFHSGEKISDCFIAIGFDIDALSILGAVGWFKFV